MRKRQASEVVLLTSKKEDRIKRKIKGYSNTNYKI